MLETRGIDWELLSMIASEEEVLELWRESREGRAKKMEEVLTE